MRIWQAPKWAAQQQAKAAGLGRLRYRLPNYALNLMSRPERYIVFYGGRGGGKSTNVAANIVDYCETHANTRVVIVRDYKASSEDTALQLTWDICQVTGAHAYKAPTGLRIYFDNNSRISLLGSERNYGQLRGLEKVSIAWVEEAHDVSHLAFRTLVPSVRGPNAKIFITFNPQDPDDYVSEYFIENIRPNSYVVKVNYGEYPEAYNPATEDEYQESLRRGDPNHPHIWGGEYRSAAGLVFHANKIRDFDGLVAEQLCQYLEFTDALIMRVRAWDLAAVQGNGNFTVGVRMALIVRPNGEGLFLVEDIVRGQWSPEEVDAQMIKAAADDGLDVAICFPQDPGAAGKRDAERLCRLLVPYTNSLICEPITGPKITRAAGFASAVNNELVYMANGPWGRPFKRELAAFTGLNTDIDDQVDAGSDAYDYLAQRVRSRRGVLAI